MRDLKSVFAGRVRSFRLPRYNELPDMGLYLEQVTKYINGYIVPLGCAELTASMVSNYVKKGVIEPPVKKQYSRDQIGYLIYIGVGKSVLSMENLSRLIGLQRALYAPETAYDYFCTELENMLLYVAGLKERIENVGITNTEVKTMFRSVIIAASYSFFLNSCFAELDCVEKERQPEQVQRDE